MNCDRCGKAPRTVMLTTCAGTVMICLKCDVALQTWILDFLKFDKEDIALLIRKYAKEQKERYG